MAEKTLEEMREAVAAIRETMAAAAREAAADLALMQLCHGFGVSNSTYSWWAQYLAEAPDKQVWAPDRWYAHTKDSALYLDGWKLIKASPLGEA